MNYETLLGIDIGSETIHVCPANPATPPASWKTHPIPLTGDWPAELLHLVTLPALAVLEPTGWHYALPIAQTLHHAGVDVLYTSNHAAAKARELHVSQHKTDANDARALAVIAQQHTNGNLRITRQFFADTSTLNTELRLLFAIRQRTVRQQTQTINRLTQTLHGVWPELGRHKELWLARLSQPPALSHADLQDALAAAQHDGLHHNTTRAIKRLADAVPDWLPVTAPQYRAAAMLAAECRRHAASLENLERQIERLTWSDPIQEITTLWWTVPGASAMGIAALHIATHCRAPEFTTAEFRAAVGSHPLRQESGHYLSSRQNKAGFRPAKAALHLWTLRLIQNGQNPIAAYFYEQQRLGKKAAIHSARGKLARILSGIARNRTACNW